MKRYLLASAILITFVPFKAQAAEIDATGAEHLKQVFTNLLNDQKEISKSFGTFDVVYTGEVAVEPKGEYYAITLPKVEIKLDESLMAQAPPAPQDPAQAQTPPATPPASEFVFDLGQTAINAVPDEKPGYWKMTVALPATLSMKIADEMAMNINIGKQNTAGLFHEEYGYFTKMDALYQDVKFNIVSMGQTTDFTIPELSMKSNLEEEEGGLLTGPTTVRASDFSFNIPDEHAMIKIGALQLDAGLKRYKAMPSGEYKTKMIEYGQKLKSMTENPSQPPSGAQIEEIVNSILGFSDFEGMNVRYSLENLDISADPPKDDFRPDEPLKALKIGSAFVGFGLDQLKSETGSFNFGFGYNDVMVDPVPPGYEGIIPNAVNIDVKANKIPIQSIWTSSMNTVKAVAQNPEMGTMAGMGLLMQLPVMLTQAGTEIEVKDNYVGSPEYKASLNGNVKADATAAMQFVANFKGQFDGLDELLTKVQANANNPKLPNAYEFNDIANQLQSMKSMGQQGTGANGKSSYAFDIQVSPDGKATINGKDIPGMGPMGAGQAPGSETPAAGDEGQAMPY
ncbi:MAG: hypothetical protein H6858_02515 [Rhodospirillales bacterium]|nr:hypothetical protein [Alphaproteobacteria bacterium]MCB1839011.1 hypothetical protein [Alphaproteobacteria bacterium]MCB9976456.1 hypothetical protein [Rhodospirillales bacterium]